MDGAHIINTETGSNPADFEHLFWQENTLPCVCCGGRFLCEDMDEARYDEGRDLHTCIHCSFRMSVGATPFHAHGLGSAAI